MWKLLKSTFAYISHYNAILPYNLNWARSWKRQAPFLSKHPIVLIDVGARGGAPQEVDSLRPYLSYVGFDADRDECARLAAHPPAGYASYQVFPRFIAGRKGRTTFHIYREPGQSSVYLPAQRFKALWGGERFSIEKSVDVDSVTLDEFFASEPGLSRPDFMKLDTQGSELDALKGGQQTLRETSLVEIEVEFVPMYEGQPLFADILQFMTANGFELLYLNRVFSARREIYAGPSRGQIIFGDALFGRTENSLRNLSPERQAKHIVLLIQFGHLDIAYQLSTELPAARALLPGIESVFKPTLGPLSLLKRALIMQFDKLLAIGLYLRKYNQRAMDSDRSWPVR
jgi:FkbM family methyltransferase